MNEETDTQAPHDRPLAAPSGSAPFDLEAVYDAEIAPLMTQIIAICRRERLPMLATFVYAKGREADDQDGECHCTTVVPRDDWQSPEINEALHIIRNGASERPKMMAFAVTSR